VFAAIKI